MGYSIKAQIYLVLDHSENCNLKFQPPPRDQMEVAETTPNSEPPPNGHGRPPIFFLFFIFFLFSFYNDILGINTYIRGNFRIFVQKTHVQRTWAIFCQRRQKSLTNWLHWEFWKLYWGTLQIFKHSRLNWKNDQTLWVLIVFSSNIFRLI
jgi:hypothetical protein